MKENLTFAPSNDVRQRNYKDTQANPEVDMNKATELQFNNSDKQAKEVILANNPEVSRAVYTAIQFTSNFQPDSLGGQ